MPKHTSYYVEGNTVRKKSRQPAAREAGRMRVVRRRMRERAIDRVMNIGYLVFLTLSLAAAGIALTYYIMLHTQITGAAGRIQTLEKQLATMTKENDEAYNRLDGNVDLEEVRRIAISEYGMRYVQEGQIITYSDGGGTDYVRQKAEIPDAGR